MRPLHAVVLGVIGVAFLTAGCSGAIPSSNGGPAALKLMSSKYGSFLADAEGHALYMFEKDERGESYCNGACAAVWPPLETSSMPHAATGVDDSGLGTIKRDNGEVQVTYHGHPLYYYAADASTPAKTKGQEIDQFGAEWYLVNANGKPVESESGKGAKQTPSSGSNSGSNSGSSSGSNSGSSSGSNSGSNSGSGSGSGSYGGGGG